MKTQNQFVFSFIVFIEGKNVSTIEFQNYFQFIKLFCQQNLHYCPYLSFDMPFISDHVGKNRS